MNDFEQRKTNIFLAVIGLIIVVAVTMYANTTLAATTVDYVPSTVNKLDIAKELKKCQCKCKRRSNMTDLMDVKEFLDEKLQEIEAQPEQRMN